MPYFLVKKYGEGMMLIWYKTNLGVGNTMVPSEIAKYCPELFAGVGYK
jgi:hypothetical protein